MLRRLARPAEAGGYRVAVTRRVVFAEDSYLVREGVKLVLESEGYNIVAAVETYDELLAAVEEHQPDVVITDIRMPPTRTDEGIRAARLIRSEHPTIGVVVLSQYIEPEYAIRLLEDGSAGIAYLLKERVGDAGELADAVERVANGESRIDPKVVDALVAGRLAARPGKLDRLTDREREVLEHMASGKTNAGIGGVLYLSERAIEKHINSIFTKLDLLADHEGNRRVLAVLQYLAERGS
jgi:DNA-binding NarL/FixJ family response regulator